MPLGGNSGPRVFLVAGHGCGSVVQYDDGNLTTIINGIYQRPEWTKVESPITATELRAMESPWAFSKPRCMLTLAPMHPWECMAE